MSAFITPIAREVRRRTEKPSAVSKTFPLAVRIIVRLTGRHPMDEQIALKAEHWSIDRRGEVREGEILPNSIASARCLRTQFGCATHPRQEEVIVQVERSGRVKVDIRDL